MTGHTKRSPSKAKQLIGCPGTLAFCDTIPEELKNVSGEAARLGTATHYLVERSLRDGKNPIDFEDRIIELVGEEEGPTMLRPDAKTPGRGRVFFIVDAEMAENATVMTDYVRDRCMDLGIDHRALIEAGGNEPGLQLETRTNPLPDRDDTSGTADVTLADDGDVLEVADYKNGFMTVEHTDNPQTKAYLLGKALERKFKYKVYRASIIQPRADHEEGAIRFEEFSKKQLLDFQKYYREKIELAEKAEAEFAKFEYDPEDDDFKKWAKKWLKAGDHCEWCDAAAICPAKRKLAEAQAQIDFEDEPRELEIQLPVKTASKSAVTSDLQQVAQILAWAPMLEALIKSANIYAQRAMEAGYEVPGQKLVARRSVRKFKGGVAQPALVKQLVAFGIPKEKLFTKPKLISGPQAEKLVPSKKRRKFNDLFLEKPPGGVTIAPIHDPRPALEATIGDDFDDDIIDGEFEEIEDEPDFG